MIFRFRLRAILAAVLVAGVLALPAATQAAPIAGVITTALPARAGFGTFAIDGTDIYWSDLTTTRKRGGIVGDYVVNRTSMLDRGTVAIWQSPGVDDAVMSLAAGGGVVAIQLEIFGGSGSGVQSQIVRFGRDGNGATVIASGKTLFSPFDWASTRHPRPRDCGTSVALNSVSGAGEVVYGVVDRIRTGAECAGASNKNIWHFKGLRPSGSTRDLLESSARIRLSRSRLRDGTVELRGDLDFAGSRQLTIHGEMMSIQSGRRIYVLNLANGTLSNDYVTPASARRLTLFSLVSLDSSGRVALTEIRGFRMPARNSRVTSNTWLFPTPGLARPRVALAEGSSTQFCGDKLIAATATGRGTGDSPGLLLTQLNSDSGAPIREIGTIKTARVNTIEGCDGTRFFTSYRGRKRIKISAIPLG